MENYEETNVLTCVDMEDLNCYVFNLLAYIDGDSILPKFMEKEVACRILLMFLFVNCLVISVLLNVCVPSFITTCV